MDRQHTKEEVVGKVRDFTMMMANCWYDGATKWQIFKFTITKYFREVIEEP